MQDITDETFEGPMGDLRAFRTPGVETFKRFIRGELVGPPVSRLLGLRPTEAGLGRATFSMPVTRWLEDGFGLYWGGVYALFADAPLACAIWTTLPAGKVVTSAELSMSFIRPMSRKTSNMVGRAEVIHSGNQVGLSMVQITDQDGRTLAFGSSRCLVVDALAAGGGGETGPAASRGANAAPDPWQRPAPEGHFTFDQITNGVPIELQRLALADAPRFPIWRLTGFRGVAVEDGHFEATLPCSPWFSNGGPAIYGGLLAWAAEFTMGAAVYSTLPPGDVFGTLDMQIRFMRPALVGPAPLRLTASVRHRGRRLRIAACDVDDAEGRRVAMATSSALVVEGGVRELMKGRLPEEILAAPEGAGNPWFRSADGD
ncbi:MAG TPA: PaaI family thioesterase [Thermoanaerobaculia bacterium]|nr:PaaI family thioesterase [Thermoanaerobaculia bacterium]